MQRRFYKGDVWLCYWAGSDEELRIRGAKKGFIKHQHGWEAGSAFNKRAKFKIGRMRKLFGFYIPFFIKR